jgi:O-antigen ligase
MTFLVLIETTLLLTMARSAWLGAVALVLCFGVGYLIRIKLETGRFLGRRWWLFLVPFLGATLASLVFVLFTPLSPFPLLERIESTGGLQTITVACNERQSLPETIESLDDLSAFGCRHITLETIEAEQSAGFYVTTVDRPDPNVTIRGEIYGRVTRLIQDHIFLGLGWGSVTALLGVDERGAGLNASNVFLEVWLGSGLLGLVAFVLFLVFMSLRLFSRILNPDQKDQGLLSLTLLALLIGFTVFNLFNSGILLGFYFLFFSVVALMAEPEL